MSGFGDKETQRRAARPSDPPRLEIQNVSLADLEGELAKSRIIGAAVEHLKTIDQSFEIDFSLSFGLHW